MFSITETDVPERVPKSSPPWVWVGFLFAGAFFILEVLFVVLDLDEASINVVLMLLVVGGWIYFLVCVYQIHKILDELSRSRYPISPGEAAAKHIIPFYNLYWLFKWPSELSDYLNGKGRVRIIPGAALGLMLLLAMLLRFFDGAIGMTFVFAVMMYISHKVKRHVKTVMGVTPDQLPPLPDPNMFSRPLETATSPAQGVVEDSRAG
ncbi:MAG TPA: hypothetical protein VFR78_08040 [Pyrinomonadaceae bacterium]|nr:hypothetical protein [Pyrinomonadaceae bacterium]